MTQQKTILNWHRMWVDAELQYRYYLLRGVRRDNDYLAFCRKRMERARVKQQTADNGEDY